MFRIQLTLLSLVGLPFVYLSCDVPLAQGRQSYDGQWWLAAKSQQRMGFLNGMADCRAFELGHKLTASRSAQEDEKLVTNFYTLNSSKRKLPVIDVLAQLDNVKGHPRASGGEGWDEPHAYWDGLWWKGSTDLERVGFIEGFLSCLSSSPDTPSRKFSRAPRDYVMLISEWYRLNDATHSMDSEREAEKIATVLAKFQDLP